MILNMNVIHNCSELTGCVDMELVFICWFVFSPSSVSQVSVLAAMGEEAAVAIKAMTSK